MSGDRNSPDWQTRMEWQFNQIRINTLVIGVILGATIGLSLFLGLLSAIA